MKIKFPDRKFSTFNKTSKFHSACATLLRITFDSSERVPACSEELLQVSIKRFNLETLLCFSTRFITDF